MIEPGDVLIYLARHATVQSDVEGRIRGLKNESLNDQGNDEAQELAEWFETTPLSGIYVDDLERTYQTALPVAESHGLEITIDPDLRSWDVGELEGKSIQAHEDEIATFKAQPQQIPTAGQSWGEFKTQALRALNRYTNIAMGMTYPILVIGHGSTIAIWGEEMGAMEQGADYEHTLLEPAGVAAIYLTRSDGLLMKPLRLARASLDVS